MLQPIRYHFSHPFKISARQAYAWCTDFTPEDQALMQEENATREIQHVSEGTVILVDTYRTGGKAVVKQKLVCMFPEKVTWTSTHLTGPYRYSQFLYQITPETDRTCCLEFTANFLDYTKKDADKAEIEKLAREEHGIDADNWRLLAGIMEKEINKK